MYLACVLEYQSDERFLSMKKFKTSEVGTCKEYKEGWKEIVLQIEKEDRDRNRENYRSK